MSVLDRFPHSTAELRRVRAVQFGVLSPDEIVSYHHPPLPPYGLIFTASLVCHAACPPRVGAPQTRARGVSLLSLSVLESK
jgi:hypothetical protein